MNLINIVSIGLLIIVALAGYGMGFGKSLKVITGGIVGFIISLFVCVAFGGTLMGFPFVMDFINNINAKAADLWAFLEYLKLGYVAFYVILFFAVQIARIIVIKIISKIHDSQNGFVVFVNRFLGAVLCLAFFSGVALLAFAGLSFIEDTGFAQNILDKISDSYLIVIYENNPISFG